ncbi:DUF192 domain-containing protein [Candidatus Microgenomates bacterium]|nr:MAG: DUF192 domain-containing protein [Candidatus Microgenomates bacterium]
MRNKYIAFAVLVVLLLAGFWVYGSKNTNYLSPFELSPTATPHHRVVVKIGEWEVDAILSQTQAEMSRGLGGVESLGENEGMLFDFTASNPPTAFWMKDMIIPIDIIWIKDGIIIQIDANAVPQPEVADSQLKLYPPIDRSVEYVLEVNAGYSEIHNISIGDVFVIVSQE